MTWPFLTSNLNSFQFQISQFLYRSGKSDKKRSNFYHKEKWNPVEGEFASIFYDLPSVDIVTVTTFDRCLRMSQIFLITFRTPK